MLYSPRIKNKDASLELLLVEDSVGDVCLVKEAIKEVGGNIKLNVVRDGIEATNYLFKKEAFVTAETPDLILLDLNIPKKDGKKILLEIKNDPLLKHIPVLVLTISQDEEDILQCYNLQANCYFIKPFEIEEFIQLFKSMIHFWLNVAVLPIRRKSHES